MGASLLAVAKYIYIILESKKKCYVGPDRHLTEYITCKLASDEKRRVFKTTFIR